jgi:hypothetical protein
MLGGKGGGGYSLTHWRRRGPDLLFPATNQGAHTPDFPRIVDGSTHFTRLYLTKAAHGALAGALRTENPVISLVFREMLDSTALVFRQAKTSEIWGTRLRGRASVGRFVTSSNARKRYKLAGVVLFLQAST